MRGVGTPGILCIMASISANLLAVACSRVMLVEERRLEPLEGRVTPMPNATRRAWLTVETRGADWQVGPTGSGRVV